MINREKLLSDMKEKMEFLKTKLKEEKLKIEESKIKAIHEHKCMIEKIACTIYDIEGWYNLIKNGNYEN